MYERLGGVKKKSYSDTFIQTIRQKIVSVPVTNVDAEAECWEAVA